MNTTPLADSALLGRLAAAFSLAIAVLFASATAASASVDVEKSTNGEDADVAPGPSLVEGELVNWSWRVSAGTSELYDIVLTDTSGAVPNCDINGDGVGDGTYIHPGPLAPGASFVCSASGRASNPGTTSVGYGEVRASDFGGTVFQDRDASHYRVVAPSPATTKPPTPTTKATTTSRQSSTTITSTTGEPASLGIDEQDGSKTGAGLLTGTGTLLESTSSTKTPATADPSTTDSVETGSESETGSMAGSSDHDDTDGSEASPEELAMTDSGGSRSFVPIGIGLFAIGVGLIVIGFRLEQLLRVLSKESA